MARKWVFQVEIHEGTDEFWQQGVSDLAVEGWIVHSLEAGGFEIKCDDLDPFTDDVVKLLRVEGKPRYDDRHDDILDDGARFI